MPDDSDVVSPDGPTRLDETSPDTSAPGERDGALVLPDIGYDVGEVIGRGGMGEVVSAHDRRIGRDVAIKQMWSETPSAATIGRFLREARIQARLDHPAIRNWTTLGITLAAFGVTLVALWIAYVRKSPHPALSLIVGGVIVLAFSRVLGPFVLTPVAIVGSLLPISASPWLNERPRWVIGWMLVVTLAPIGLEWLGVFQSTWSMIDGGVCATSAMLRGLSSLDGAMLVVVNLVLISAVAVYGINVNRRTAAANHKLFTLAWHLGHLLPAGRVSLRSIPPVEPRS